VSLICGKINVELNFYVVLSSVHRFMNLSAVLLHTRVSKM
jgi:hypothetical protein